MNRQRGMQARCRKEFQNRVPSPCKQGKSQPSRKMTEAAFAADTRLLHKQMARGPIPVRANVHCIKRSLGPGQACKGLSSSELG